NHRACCGGCALHKSLGRAMSCPCPRQLRARQLQRLPGTTGHGCVMTLFGWPTQAGLTRRQTQVPRWQL
ncbi:MAG: hypothetical protein ACRD68_14845, partial [Pyrinomonadaceae bacterium]